MGLGALTPFPFDALGSCLGSMSWRNEAAISLCLPPFTAWNSWKCCQVTSYSSFSPLPDPRCDNSCAKYLVTMYGLSFPKLSLMDFPHFQHLFITSFLFMNRPYSHASMKPTLPLQQSNTADHISHTYRLNLNHPNTLHSIRTPCSDPCLSSLSCFQDFCYASNSRLYETWLIWFLLTFLPSSLIYSHSANCLLRRSEVFSHDFRTNLSFAVFPLWL